MSRVVRITRTSNTSASVLMEGSGGYWVTLTSNNPKAIAGLIEALEGERVTNDKFCGTANVPEDLVKVAPTLRDGCVLYGRIGDSKAMLERLTFDRLNELTAEGWLTKSVSYIDQYDEQYEVEFDDDGLPFANGDEIHEDEIRVAYLTTKKVSENPDALEARGKRAVKRAKHGILEAIEAGEVPPPAVVEWARSG